MALPTGSGINAMGGSAESGEGSNPGMLKSMKTKGNSNGMGKSNFQKGMMSKMRKNTSIGMPKSGSAMSKG